MRVALDAMGGDDAPRAMVQGAVDFARANPEHSVILVGIESTIAVELKTVGGKPANIEIEHAPDVIGMAEKIQALKDKPNDSMNRTAMLVKQGKADAMVLCGNTGCSVAAAQLHLRRIPGVKRAGIVTKLPKPNGYTFVCDCGANSVCRPEHLVQFAEMTVALLQAAYGKTRPSVGVLSIGEEDGKGDDLTGSTLEQLRKTNLNVVGNVEGNDIYSGDVDVIVCDGFTGNVMLKASEGVAGAIMHILKDEIRKSLRTKIGALLMKNAFKEFKSRTDWRLAGGALLIGVDGITIIGHGRSDRSAVFHALGHAAHCVNSQVLQQMRVKFQSLMSTVEA